MAVNQKPHAVCFPYPAQGHIGPMLKLAKILHHKGFYITFVHTEFNYARLLRSRGPDSLRGLPTFRFETIPDGLPPPQNPDATQNVTDLCISTTENCLVPFRNLCHRLNSMSDVPPVSCIVPDGTMTFALQVAEELGVPGVLFCTNSAYCFLCYLHFPELIRRGFTPLKDASYLTNGYLDTVIDWIPGIKSIRLRDLPSHIRTTNPNDRMLEFGNGEISKTHKASAIILNTFNALESDVLESLSSILKRIYTIGPLQLLLDRVTDDDTKTIGSNLWKEDPGCLDWLHSQEPESVVYINFGSITVVTPNQLFEFAWGLANSKQKFLWIIRPDLVTGDPLVLPPEFLTETKNRGMIASWCDQEQVLKHPSIGGFLTHCGWNSTIESVSAGVPMSCWPFIADQQTNCMNICREWGVGIEIDSDVKREKVERVVRELMEGEKGKEMKKRVMELKKKAEEATSPSQGSSFLNLNKMVEEVLLLLPPNKVSQA
ncbi:7-deoxyloganetin glucosyltransferase-like [Cornus florida]|uniref:7-deoxyloganetin glucosyltransferase-like n=1 Tax=Cornus florida TaxID=4283 RepID=UPI0028974F2C|nr:7-deoxyloganetin glucosyltransferase-like [Cornus florida]